jgi:hypothetical protein
MSLQSHFREGVKQRLSSLWDGMIVLVIPGFAISLSTKIACDIRKDND